MADSVRSKLPTISPRVHQTTIHNLPDPIIADILSRLPTKTIFLSRFVCKLWNYLTTKDSYFPKSHFSRSRSEFLLQFKDELNKGVANWIDPEFDMTQGFGTHVLLKPRTRIPYTNCGLVSSCCGLVFCLDKGDSDLGYICNPLTGEYLSLPICDKGEKLGDQTEDPIYGAFIKEIRGWRRGARYCFNAYAFGYCSSTNRFKVLRIFSNVSNSEWMDTGVAGINVVGSDTWRGIGIAPLCPDSSCPILVNGVVHWLCDDNMVEKFIVYFNFESEKFGEFEPPLGIAKDYQKRKHKMTLSVLGGCLAVCDMLRTGKFDIWVMKQNGDRESWSKDFVVDTTVFKMSIPGRHRPLKVLRNGEILMLSLGHAYKYPKFLCYNPKDHAVRMLKLLYYFKFEVVAHTASFMSLKDVIMGDNLNVLNLKDGVSNNGHGSQRLSPDPFLVEHRFARVDGHQSLPY